MKSSLFLMEQLIAILVFAICSAVCVSLFADAFIVSAESRDMNNALVIAKIGAECYKSASGSVEETALILDGDWENNTVCIYYDEFRRSCDEKSAVYILRIVGRNPEEIRTLSFGDLSIAKSGGEEILAFTVASRR